MWRSHLISRWPNDNTEALPRLQMRCAEFLSIAFIFISFGVLLQACGQEFKPAGQIKSTIALKSSIPALTFSKDGLFARVTILGDELVHVESAAGAPPPVGHLHTTPMVAASAFPGPSAFQREEDAKSLSLSTPRMRVQLDKETLCVETARANGPFEKDSVLTRVCPEKLNANWKSLTFDVPVVRAAYGLGQHFSNPETSDGDLVGRLLESGPYGNELRGFSGGANSVVQIPVFFVLRDDATGFGVFFDNAYKQRWDLRSRPWKADAFGNTLSYFVFANESLRDARAAYMSLTGRPPVPPRKMFGLWVSEFGFDSWQELERKRKGLLDAGIPHDGFVLDLQWFGGEFFGSAARMGRLTFHEPWFPNAKENIERLKAAGAGLITVEESYVDAKLPEHSDLAQRGYLARKCEGCAPAYLTANPWWGKGGMIDWSLPAAGDYWHDLKREPLVDLGILGHWTDLGEPEMYDENAWYHGFPNLGLHAHADVHNLYSLLWSESISRGYSRNARRERPFILSRAGAAGIQRTGAAMWSGDIGANLGALKAQATAQSHMSFSGIDYYGSDVGGFHRWSLDGDVGALYTQWFAQSALFDLPVRPHSWNTANIHETSPHAIGHVPSNRANARLRYELFPYYYALAHAASREGSPFVYPPLLDFPADPILARLGHQKMIGPWLLSGLVADYRGTQRAFYFPDADWYDFRTGVRVRARAEWINEVPTVDENGRFTLPLFARGGALVPLESPVPGKEPALVGSLGSSKQNLRVRAFPSDGKGTHRFTVVEDDGESIAYREGALAETPLFSRTEDDRLVEIRIGPTRGVFEDMETERSVTIEPVAARSGDSLHTVTFNGAPLPACKESKAPCFDGTPKTGERKTSIQLGTVARSHEIRLALNWTTRAREAPSPRALLFVCEDAKTQDGEGVYAVGSHARLGAWNLTRAVRLEPTLYPHWSRVVDGFQVDERVEWKCVKMKDADKSVVAWSSFSNVLVHIKSRLFAQPTRQNF